MKKFRYRFRAGWIPTLAFLLLLPLLLGLGFWQLDRARQKQEALDLQQARKADPLLVLDGSQGELEALRFRQVTATGIYDRDHQFLVDNQVYQGRAGFFVLTPLKLAHGDRAVLVNRGWIPGSGDRSQRPDLRLAEINVSVTGMIKQFPSVGLRLQGAEIPTPGWPAIVQVVDADYLAGVVGYPLLPYQLLLDVDAGEGYVREWRADTRMPPEKHRGYAFQWFALAATLVFIFLWRSFRPISGD